MYVCMYVCMSGVLSAADTLHLYTYIHTFIYTCIHTCGALRKVSYAVTRFEAERLCVVYKQPARAVAGWQVVNLIVQLIGSTFEAERLCASLRAALARAVAGWQVSVRLYLYSK